MRHLWRSVISLRPVRLSLRKAIRRTTTMLPTVDVAGPVLLLIIVAIVSCLGLCVAVASVGCLLWLVARRRPVRSPLFGASRPE